MLTEFAVLILIALGGVAIAWQLGIRKLWLSVPAGLMISVVIRDVLFATMNMVHQRWIGAFAFFGILALGLVVSAWQAGRGLYKNMLLGTALAILAVFSTRVLGFQGTPHGDSLWILSFAHLFDINGNIAFLNGHTAIKRGFSYPLLLSLGPSGQSLSGITPYIFGALGCLVIWAIKELVGAQPRKRVYWVAGLLFATTFSTVMPLRAIYYVNGHTLTAVGLLAVAVAVTIAVRDYHLTREQMLVICIGVFTASTSRIEGIVMAALLVLPGFLTDALGLLLLLPPVRLGITAALSRRIRPMQAGTADPFEARARRGDIVIDGEYIEVEPDPNRPPSGWTRH